MDYPCPELTWGAGSTSGLGQQSLTTLSTNAVPREVGVELWGFAAKHSNSVLPKVAQSVSDRLQGWLWPRECLETKHLIQGSIKTEWQSVSRDRGCVWGCGRFPSLSHQQLRLEIHHPFQEQVQETPDKAAQQSP